MHVEVWDMKKT